ncbi:FIVAR domain-containing protein, partial [Acinetobacter baumannii]|nr:FIVAR domain-containing protein [Acinetobacter baumannii]
VINTTTNLNKEDYTEESWRVYEDALNNGKLVLAKEDATQEEVNNAKTTLESAIDSLVKKENQEIEKRHLKIAIDYAEKLNQDGGLEGVVPVVVDKFHKELKEAKEVYENINATTEEVDLAFDELMKVIHMLEFKQGNKDELQRMVDIIIALEKDKLIETTWVKLEAELEKANKLLEDENAMQAEIDKTFDSLV